MDDVTVKSIVSAYIREAEDHVQSEILDAQQDADDLYLGNKLGNEIEGRSAVVDRTTLDAVEWMVPQLMRMFHGSDQPVSFDPSGPEDEEAAQQATAYVSYIYNRDNPGSEITESVLRSALLYRFGVAKRWWDVKTEITEEDHTGLSLEALTLLLDEDGVELVGGIEVEQDENPEPPPEASGPEMMNTGGMTPPAAMGGEAVAAAPPMASQPGGGVPPSAMPPAAMGGAAPPPGAPPMAPPPPPVLFSVRIKRKTERKRECIEAVPVGEFLVDKRCKRPDFSDATLVGHRTSKTRSELVALGYDRALVDTLPFDNETEEERHSPFDASQDRADDTGEQSALDKANRLVSYYELWINLDEDDDGIAERRRICCAGRQATVILADEITDGIPFHGFTPTMLVHRLVGLGTADKTKDIQIVKTTLWRQMLDGLYLSTSPVTDIAVSALDPSVGLDDMMVRRPGGIRRWKNLDGVRDSIQQWGGSQAFPMLEYLDGEAESRTGVSRQSAALSPDLLNPNVTATNGLQAVTAQQAVVGLIAQRFAEGFLKPLFLGVLKDTSRYQDKARMIRLRGQWVEMDPRSWNAGMDVVVNVGLGTAANDKRLAMLAQVLSIQKGVLDAGGLGGMVTPVQLHNTFEDLVRAGELSGVERYFAQPQPPDPNAPPPPSPEMTKVEGELKLKQAELQMRMQGDQAKAQMDAQTQAQKTQADMAAQQAKAQAEIQVERERMLAQMAIERWKAEQEFELRKVEMAGEFELKKLQIAQAGRQQSETNIPRAQ